MDKYKRTDLINKVWYQDGLGFGFSNPRNKIITVSIWSDTIRFKKRNLYFPFKYLNLKLIIEKY